MSSLLIEQTVADDVQAILTAASVANHDGLTVYAGTYPSVAVWVGQWQTAEQLRGSATAAANCEVVVHCDCMSYGDDDENRAALATLVDACRDALVKDTWRQEMDARANNTYQALHYDGAENMSQDGFHWVRLTFALMVVVQATTTTSTSTTTSTTTTTTTTLAPSFQNLYSLIFDGVDEYGRLTSTAMGTVTGLSLSLWFKGAAADAGTRRLAIMPNGGGTVYNVISAATSTSCTFIKVGGGAVTLTYNTGLYNDAWHHLLATVGANGTARLIIDGVIRASAAYNTDIPESTSASNWDVSSTAFRWKGYIDEHSLWTAQLTDGGGAVGTTATGQAAELYNAGVPADLLEHSAAASLWAWWRMGDDDGSYPPLVITDASGNGRHMTFVNSENTDIVAVVP